jgi:hypothetical protein
MTYRRSEELSEMFRTDKVIHHHHHACKAPFVFIKHLVYIFGWHFLSDEHIQTVGELMV